MELYVRTDAELNDLASLVAGATNIADTNPTQYQREQCRESVNMGGTYYLFEVFGFELTLLKNRGEVTIPERESWPYYIVVSSQLAQQNEVTEVAARVLAELLRRLGLEVELDDLAA